MRGQHHRQAPRRPRSSDLLKPGQIRAQHLASGMEARQGDARKRHCQENNKTDNNQGSSNQSQNRRKKRIIKGKVM
nr:pilus protein [Escherichia coli]